MGIMQKKYQIQTIQAQMMDRTKLAYEFLHNVCLVSQSCLFAEFCQIPQKNKLKQIGAN